MGLVLYLILALFLLAIFIPFAVSQDIGTVDNATLANITAEAHLWLGEFSWLKWKRTAEEIRSKPGLLSCLIELSIAIDNTSVLYQTQYSAAAGLMAVLPTIGALIGSPTKNLWIIYKLLPICGVLALMQSLGGQLLPEDLDREKEVGGLGFADTYNEWALMQELPSERRRRREESDAGWEIAVNRVRTRARSPPEGSNSSSLWGGLAVMISCQLVMVGIMYIGEAGGIIAWWCTCWGWMFLWYFMVTMGSFLDSWANSPYPRVWKIKATIHPSSGPVDPNCKLSPDVETEIHHLITRSGPKSRRLHPRHESYDLDVDPLPRKPQRQESSDSSLKESKSQPVKPLRITPFPTTSDYDPFCILITRRGVSNRKKFFRLLMRIINSGFFIIATGLFSSVTLMSLNMAVAITSCLAAAGMIARIAAMWLVHYTNLSDSCVHLPVKTDEDAIELFGRIVREPGIKFELGHAAFYEGRVERRSWRARMKWDIFGLVTR